MSNVRYPSVDKYRHCKKVNENAIIQITIVAMATL